MASTPLSSLWDAHVHLPTYPDPDSVLTEASGRGIRLVSVSVSPKDAGPSLALRKRSPATMRCFIGVHPSEAASAPGLLESLSLLWEAADGVGEVGLDPKYSPVDQGSAQMGLFEGQLDVAERLGKPLQVHSRGAEASCLDALDVRSLGSVLMHWFESEELLGRAISRPRTFVSFGPALLYSKKILRCAKKCPPERALVESDGPVSFTALGGAEGPGLVPSVAFKLAEVWRLSLDEAVARLSLNTEQYLG